MRLAELKANYAGTRLYKQEIEGVFNDDVAGALFTLDMISEARISTSDVPESLSRVVVDVAPAQTATEGADESGIIVVGDDGQGHAYVLADYSLRGSPEQVMRRAVAAYQTHSADVICFEDQSGGDWLVTALRHVDPGVPYKKVHAMRGKFLRAQPVAMLMEQGRIHHAGSAEDFERLEDQLCAITEDSDRSKAHDDRADAYVYAIARAARPVRRQLHERVFHGQVRGMQARLPGRQGEMPAVRPRAGRFRPAGTQERPRRAVPGR